MNITQTNQMSLESILSNIKKDDLLCFKGLNDEYEVIYYFITYNGSQTVKMCDMTTPTFYKQLLKKEYKCRAEYLINSVCGELVDLEKEQEKFEDENF